MKPVNLLSTYRGATVYNEMKAVDSSITVPKPYMLKNHEVKTLYKLCKELKKSNAPVSAFDGFFVGYTIPQIGKEFDLLRFSDSIIINVEMKETINLPQEDKIIKILKQQVRNYHYLSALKREVYISTFVANDGFYKYDPINNTTKKVACSSLICVLKNQRFDESINPNNLFKPYNYLISPFNKTKQFIHNEYFLTKHQEYIKSRVLESINGKYSINCITADAGTGKTLLLYDIAKAFLKSALIIHCGKLNEGHLRLKYSYKWNIKSIRDIGTSESDNNIDENVSIIFIDEAQRIRSRQLDAIVDESIKKRIPIIFSYDVNQYLSVGENKNISDYIKQNYNLIPIEHKLTKKIRTNPEIASFISNLKRIGSENTNTNYRNITVEYYDDLDELSKYLKYLTDEKQWKFITYTNSRYNTDPFYQLSQLSIVKAHDVIGQEFNKVVFIMDSNFAYDRNNELRYNKKSYYDLYGMFYQIVTRAVSNLKVIVLNNKPLFYKLLYIKSSEKEIK